MHCKQHRSWLAMVWLAAVLAGCGGGGGGGSGDGGGVDTSTIREPLPTLVQDVVPTGTRLDLRDRNYFPAQAGDSWTYDVVRQGVTTPGGATKLVTAAEGAEFWVSETVLNDQQSARWRRTAEGFVVLNAGDGLPAAAARIVGDILTDPEPFYPVGAERRIIRQGTWGADVDGDGRDESFRLEITDVLVGFETLALPRGSAEAAHFRTVSRITVTPSKRANPPITLENTDHLWRVPGVGVVRREYVTLDGDGGIVEPSTVLQIAQATVGGVKQLQAPIDGAVQKLALVHYALVYDRTRNVYYASVPGSVVGNGNRIATIDAASGQVRDSAPVGADPGALALSADGGTLYVALNGSGELLRLALPSLQEMARTRLPAPAFYGQLLAENLTVSPVDAGVVAVSMRRTSASPRHAGVALIRDGVLQPQMTQDHTGSNLVAFAADGQWLYGYNNETTEFGLRRIEVLADGLAERQVVSTSSGFNLRALDVSAQGPVLGKAQYRGSDLALLGEVGTAQGGGCRVPLAANRLVCLKDSAFTGSSSTGGRLVVTDASSFVTLQTPAYLQGSGPPAGVEIVPGPAGQVALRSGSVAIGQPATEVWLFTSPQLP